MLVLVLVTKSTSRDALGRSAVGDDPLLGKFPHLSALISCPDDLPGGTGEHHAVVDQAHDLDDTIRCQAVDDEVARRGDTMWRFDAEALSRVG